MNYSPANLTRTVLYLLVCLLLLVAARANAQEMASLCQPYQPFAQRFEGVNPGDEQSFVHYSVEEVGIDLMAGADCYEAVSTRVDSEQETDVGAVRMPEEFTLEGNYPNPFNPTTNVVFNLPAPAQVSVQVFDILGRQVMELPVRQMSAGSQRSVQLDASRLSSGTYLYRLVAETRAKRLVKTGRMTLLK